jgi:signal transduction histidine kinase
MARRIVLTMLALVGALLVIAVIPLGLLTTARERGSFQEETLLSARAVAAVAEDGLTEHPNSQAMVSALTRASLSGEDAWVYTRAGRLVAHTRTAGSAGDADAVRLQVQPGAVQAVRRHGGTVVTQARGQLQVATRVADGSGGSFVGVVVLARSTGELDERLRVLWTGLAAIAAAGLVAGVLVAVGFARWVGRPLSALDAAAQRLGGDALDTRSVTEQGPPEVRRLAGTFNAMAGRLDALVHGHRATMADVSHQLRTPLAALRLRLDVLAQDADPDTAAELADAQEEIARLSHLVDGLLAVARAENAVTEPVAVAVDEVIGDRVAAWAPVAGEREVTLTVSGPCQMRASLGDGHLEQILDNLLANALDAVPAGGHVRVSAQAGGRGVQIVVADDGSGMSQAQQEGAFRRFASNTSGGTGLGLAIVHRLVTSNGGTAALSDTAGGGLTVTLDLPAAQPGQVRQPADAVSRKGDDSLPVLNSC